MANKNVVVLAPNGRRQKVAVTPNTTILQVMEEVCQKHGYNVDDYDLKHFNHVLDANAILRFTGLANNAQLEMIPCKKARAATMVVIGIQLESGERLMGEFSPNTTLIEVLQNVNLHEDLDRITLTYMHCEITGKEALSNTTLKSLGLNSGKAVLRVLHKNPENRQTVVASIIPKTIGNNENSNRNKSIISNKTADSVATEKQGQKESTELEVCSQIIERKAETSIKTNETNEIMISTNTDDNSWGKISSAQSSMHESSDLNTVDFIGDRNALIFNQATVQGRPKDEQPDDFYELTVHDAKILLRDAKRIRQELEEAPFITNVQRQLNQQKEMSNQLYKYPLTIIRVHFPDQFVLQGLFTPMETVQAIKDFTKHYLTDADSDFIIFTTPPKRVLDPKSHLAEENLVPCAIVYYSGPSTLKSEIKEKATDPENIEMQVSKVRKSMIAENRKRSENVKTNDSTNRTAPHVATSSESSSSKKDGKIPKWFKPL